MRRVTYRAGKAMPEQLAAEFADRLTLDAESDGLLARKGSVVSKVLEVHQESRRLTQVISTEHEDRYGDVVRQDGLSDEHYRHNPVVLWAHNSWRPPIGKSLELTKTKHKGEKATVSVTEFASTELAVEVYELYVGGFMNCTSIGFRPEKWDAMYEDGGRFIGFDFLKCDLMEYSAVPIPANPHALTLAMKDGDFKAIRPWLRSLEDASRSSTTPEPASADVRLASTHNAVEAALTAMTVANAAARMKKNA